MEEGSEEERWCKARHVENNTFGEGEDEQGLFRTGSGGGMEVNEGASHFIEGEEVRVVLVGVREGRIADWKGGVKDWTLAPDVERGRGGLVNGAS